MMTSTSTTFLFLVVLLLAPLVFMEADALTRKDMKKVHKKDITKKDVQKHKHKKADPTDPFMEKDYIYDSSNPLEGEDGEGAVELKAENATDVSANATEAGEG